jgi:hypothetical protein
VAVVVVAVGGSAARHNIAESRVARSLVEARLGVMFVEHELRARSLPEEGLEEGSLLE